MAGYTANAQMMGQKNSQNKKQGMMMQKSDMMQGSVMIVITDSGMCPMCSKYDQSGHAHEKVRDDGQSYSPICSNSYH